MLFYFQLEATWKTHFTFFLSHTLTLARSLIQTHPNQHPSPSSLKASMLLNVNTIRVALCIVVVRRTLPFGHVLRAPDTDRSTAGRGDAKDNTSCVNAGTPLSSALMTHKRKHTAYSHDNSNCTHIEKSLFLQINNLLCVCVCVCVCVCIVNVSQTVANRSRRGQQQATTESMPSRYCSTYLCRYSSQHVCESTLARMVILHKCGCLSINF